MRNPLSLFLLFICGCTYGQFIQVDSQSFTPQQLIEDVLVDSNCISDVLVTNVVGGDFQGADESFGYFDASGTDFPFENGVVLSTGRLQNVDGPNNTLSDDDAPGWEGDTDLEEILNESNTTNATILEFDFTTAASEVSFRYLFASEEYQEGNPNTCRFSDLFGFLIRPEDSQQYENIALVPDTQTPVKVTTVHPEIPGGCAAENEFYFERFNDATAPINFDGQTKVLTASTQVVPNTPYHVKLVIADEQNFRFDSAVFLEGGSFKLATDLGENKLLSTANALCPDESLPLDATNPQATGYAWFRNDQLLPTAVSGTYTVEDAGTYRVEVSLGNGCQSFGEIVVEYGELPEVFDTSLQQCDVDNDGRALFNLLQANDAITDGDNELVVVAYYTSESLAIANTSAIPDPRAFMNTSAVQEVYARVENRSGCFSVATVQLSTSFNRLDIATQIACDVDDNLDGFTSVDLNAITADLQSSLPTGATVTYYKTEGDALFEVNGLSSPYLNEDRNRQTLFARVEQRGACYAISDFEIIIASPPVLPEDETVPYCTNTSPVPILIDSGVQSPSLYDFNWTFNGASLPEVTPSISINEIGIYTVTVTSVGGCSGMRTITVIPSELPVVTDVVVSDASTNNTVTISVSGGGVYEFALDNASGPFQESGVFMEVAPGNHIIYIRDRNGCGIIAREVSVIGFPRYFTPNGDGFHDTWRVQGLPSDAPPKSFMIFDRFGKLLFTAKNFRVGWNGIYNGQVLPTNGYWYRITLADGRTFSGGFSLIR